MFCNPDYSAGHAQHLVNWGIASLWLWLQLSLESPALPDLLRWERSGPLPCLHPVGDLVIAARPHEVAIAGHGSRRDTAPWSVAVHLFAPKNRDSAEYCSAKFLQLVIST